MSKSLAELFDRDLSASDETIERARQARKRCAELNIDVEAVFEK